MKLRNNENPPALDWGEFVKNDCPLSQEQVEGIINHSKNQGIEKYYILSLTNLEDDLFFWSMYSKFDGYNIEFDSEKLSSVFSNISSAKIDHLDSYTTFSVKVVYEEKEIYPLFKYLYTSTIRKLPSIIERYSAMLSLCVICSVFIKMPAFQSESERRIIFTKFVTPSNLDDNKEVRFGTRDGYLYPFIEVPIYNKINKSDCPISAIIVGPLGKKDTSVPGLRWFLKKLELEHISVRKSVIPLRP